MNRAKRQHYVPRFYLRNFSPDQRSIFVFDKRDLRTFPAALEKVAAENGFFDLAEADSGGENPQLESILADCEAMWADDLRDLLHQVRNLGRIDLALKHRFAHFVATQYLRTRDFRELCVQTEAGLRAFLEKTFGPRRVASILVDKPTSLRHALTAFSPRVVQSLRGTLQQRTWIFQLNRTSQPFFTSDNPVGVMTPPGQPFGVGLPGTQFVMPLSSDCAMSTADPRVQPDVQCDDGSVVEVHQQECVDFLNRAQLESAYRWLYCERDCFANEIELCHQHPCLQRPNIRRPRFAFSP